MGLERGGLGGVILEFVEIGGLWWGKLKEKGWDECVWKFRVWLGGWVGGLVEWVGWLGGLVGWVG